MINVVTFKYKDGGIHIIKTMDAFVLDNKRNELRFGESVFCLKNVKSVTVANKVGSLEVYKV